VIRPAAIADAPAVAAVVAAAYSHYIARIGKPPGPMNDDYPARVEAGQTWVLEQDGEIAGILVLEETPAGFLLDNVAVHPAHHGKGLGRLLIAFAEAEASRRGYDAIILYTHEKMTENIALYTRLGFAETARIAEKGFSRVYMRKSL
jgi:ribosomal protein S18 acetylase RimI-like enzyme